MRTLLKDAVVPLPVFLALDWWLACERSGCLLPDLG